MSNINCTCPHCQKEMSFPYAAVGQQGNCSGCQQVITIQPDLPPPLPNPAAKQKKIIIIAASAASAVGIVLLCLISIPLVSYFIWGGSGKADFDATGKEIFNALSQRSVAKLQSHMFNDTIINNINAKIREDVPESLQAAYDESMDDDFFSEEFMAEVSSLFIGFYSKQESRHPELKSRWKNIEYIGITGFLPPEGLADGRERFIDEYKLDFEYSGSYDPDVVMEATIWFRLDDEIYAMRGLAAMVEFDGKLYAFPVEHGEARIENVIKETFPFSADQLTELRLYMYGNTEKVLAQVKEELGL